MTVLGFPLSGLCFDGPEEDLKLTENTQPALLTVSIAALTVLEKRRDMSRMCCRTQPRRVFGPGRGRCADSFADACGSFASGDNACRRPFRPAWERWLRF